MAAAAQIRFMPPEYRAALHNCDQSVLETVEYTNYPTFDREFWFDVLLDRVHPNPERYKLALALLKLGAAHPLSCFKIVCSTTPRSNPQAIQPFLDYCSELEGFDWKAALCYACRFGHIAVVDQILKRIDDPQRVAVLLEVVKLHKFSPREIQFQSSTPFLQAVIYNQAAMVEHLVRIGLTSTTLLDGKIVDPVVQAITSSSLNSLQSLIMAGFPLPPGDFPNFKKNIEEALQRRETIRSHLNCLLLMYTASRFDERSALSGVPADIFQLFASFSGEPLDLVVEYLKIYTEK